MNFRNPEFISWFLNIDARRRIESEVSEQHE
jgi:hypothetical protein